MKNLSTLCLTFAGLAIVCSLTVTSCGASPKDREAREQAAANATNEEAADKAPAAKKEVAFKADSGRVFVRTADLYFKVKDVKLATFDIERIVRENRGYVTHTDLESTVNYKNSVRVSKDSLRETTHYTVRTDMTIRVPNTELDKTLSEIAVLFDYLDHRRVHAQDITRDLKLSALSQANFKTHKQRIEKVIDEKGKKLNSTLEAENSLYEKQAVANQNQVETQELNYDVAYSTLTISIYQNESQKSEVLAFSQPVNPYEPPFGEKMLNACSTGLMILGEILLFFVRLWPLWFLGIGTWLLVRRLARAKRAH